MIGLGEMGLPMALNLAAAGVPLVVFDARPEPIEAAVAAGATAVGSAAEVGSRADVIGIVVRDEPQIWEILRGDDGVASPEVNGKLLLVHSTIGPSAVGRIAAAAVKSGLAVLDAPISGMRMRAEAGTLTFLVGGEAEHLERARIGLDAMGERVFHVGPLGAGQVAKLANNLISLSSIMVVAEGVSLAEAWGIEEELLLDVVQASSGDSWIARNWDFIRHRWRREHPLGGAGVADMVGKDLRLALDLAHELALAVPSAALAAQLVPPIVGRERLFAEGETD